MATSSLVAHPKEQETVEDIPRVRLYDNFRQLILTEVTERTHNNNCTELDCQGNRSGT